MSSTAKQILISIASGVITAVIVNFMNHRETPPPVSDNSQKDWWQ